ncbi:hypothetical protein EON80_22800 [bacterium]|nr:MAG: hypothetical protein EON80_22800 [bacterium]
MRYSSLLVTLALSGVVTSSTVQAAPKSALGAKPSTIKLSDADNRKTVTAKVGDKLEIRLISNASTGFGWVLENGAPKGLATLGTPLYLAAKTRMPGAPGVQVWHFKVMSRNLANLKLNYRRVWEKGQPPAKTWSVTVKVK